MQMCQLHNGTYVSASEYDPSEHGSRIYCMDKNCRAPVIFIPKNQVAAAHFKTTGKGESVHVKGCGFYQPLDTIETIEKINEYQADVLEHSVKEIIIRMNMKRIDPDYEAKVIEREEKKETKSNMEVKVKDEKKPPQSISSVSSIVKLLNSYEPDTLSSVLLNVGSGKKIPLSDVVVNQVKAHQLLWEERLIPNLGYFVYGKVVHISKREKVLYINLEKKEDVPFTLVLFQRYWSQFSYTEDDLLGKQVLVFGHLRKNDYEGKTETEMLIKSDKYLEIIKEKSA